MGTKQGHKQTKDNKIDQDKVNQYLKRKNYGNKWYIKPGKWGNIMKKSNRK